MTGIQLSPAKTDVTSPKYEHTDFLLCHDDDIHDDEKQHGRRIAFIYYLVPDDWSLSDGGHLDLFKVDGSHFKDSFWFILLYLLIKIKIFNRTFETD